MKDSTVFTDRAVRAMVTESGGVGADKGDGMIGVLVFDEKGFEVMPDPVVHLLVLVEDGIGEHLVTHPEAMGMMS